MRASLRSPPLSALPAALALAAGCGSSSSTAPSDAGSDGSALDGSLCQSFSPPPSFNPAAPVVSFTNDVLPIFQASCSLSSSCHNSTSTSPDGIYLGARGAAVYANLVGVPATELPSMVRVKPGDPEGSFLLRRIDGDACALAGCTATSCTEIMPQGGPALESARLLTIRAWIAQGALSDLADAGPIGDAAADASAVDSSPADAGPPGTDANDAAAD